MRPFKRQKEPAYPQEEPKDIPTQESMTEKIFKTINFGPIKDFVTFGLNKTLINLKIQKLADIKAREALMTKKESRDYIKLMSTILIIVVIGVIIYGIITGFMGQATNSQAIFECNRKLGECMGRAVAGAVSPGGTIPG